MNSPTFCAAIARFDAGPTALIHTFYWEPGLPGSYPRQDPVLGVLEGAQALCLSCPSLTSPTWKAQDGEVWPALGEP